MSNAAIVAAGCVAAFGAGFFFFAGQHVVAVVCLVVAAGLMSVMTWRVGGKENRK